MIQKRSMFNKKVASWLIAGTMLLGNLTPVFNVQVNASVTQAITQVSSLNSQFVLNGDTLNITTGLDQLDVQVCAPQIMKVNYKPGGVSDPDTLVIDPNKKWGTGNIKASDLTSDPIVIKTSNMIVKINKADLGISVYNSSNGLLIRQTALPSQGVTFSHNSGDNFYGISGYRCGDTPSDGTKRNGTYTIQAGGQGYNGGPYTWSNNGYGILVDSDGGQINVQDTTLSYTGISKKNTEYFVMVGNPTEIMSAEAQISGTSPMSPKWATGFTNTQWGWPSTGGTDEDQLKAVINKYRTDGYPIDNFCLDFDWKSWGTGQDYGEFNWNTTNFPGGPSGELKSFMDSKGVKMTGIMKPRLFTGTQEATDMDTNGWWLPTTGVINDYCAQKPVKQVDFSIPGLRNWWWNQSKAAFNTGIVGFWNDEVDSDNGFKNFDGLNMQRAMYEGQTAITTTQRVWSLNRNFYVGAQRYGYGLWSGDIGSGFNSMKSQKDRLIAAVNIGEPKWGMDTGGFNGTPNSENYARWMEFSAFVPIFRVHGQKVPDTSTARYPWNFGDIAASAAKSVMHLRYQLIPYIYKYDAQASDTGVGLVKSLMMAYPNDPNVAADTDSWMFGDSLLVSPVLDQAQTSKSIYLPEGTWTDYFTGKTYSGGQTINYAVDSVNWSDVPLFIKQGAIIPSQDYENYVGEKKMTNIYVDAFPDSKTTSFDYYDDDGNSTTYKDGNSFKQKMTLSRSDDWKAVQFTTGVKSGTYTPDVQNYIVKLHVKSTGAVTVGGQTLTKYNSLDALKSATGEGYATGIDVYGDVVYAKVTAGQEKTILAPCTFAPAVAQTATVYAKSTATTANFQYTVDGGTTWSVSQAMTQSDKIGYLMTTFSYTLTSNSPVSVRYLDSTGYKPSIAGVALPSTGSIFTIAKDGTLSVGKPVMNTANIYIKTSTTNTPIIQYLDESGNWSINLLMDTVGADPGQFIKTLSYSAENSTLVIRYSDDNGATWKPSSSGQAITTGDYMNDITGAIVSGNPNWLNAVIVYYKKGYATPYIHWRAVGGTWTTVPGDKMADSEVIGYAKAVLPIGLATSAEICFNNGSGTWDNNGGGNYILSAGTSTFDTGKITSGKPSGTINLIVSANIKGGSYTKAQTVSLTASDTSASIYYTLDGTTTPTSTSTKYTAPIVISATTTLQAIAVDTAGNKSAVDKEIYTIGAIPSITVHYKNPTGWGAPKLYAYDANKVTIGLAWPGNVMTGEVTTGWYVYTIPNCSAAKIIFTDGTSQNPASGAAGLDVITGEYWYANGAWTTNPTTVSVSADVKGGSYTAAQKVTMTATPNTASIYYTLDGTTPTAASTKYTAAINIASSLTLKFIAIDSASVSSPVYTETYVINIAALTAAANIKGGTYTAAQRVTLTPSRTASIYYTLDGTTPTAASTKYTAAINIASSLTLKFIAIDSASVSSPVYTEAYVINISPTYTPNTGYKVDYDSSTLLQGKSFTVYYNGSLASSTTVSLHWGYNGFTVPTNAVMTKRTDGFWEATVTIPATATKLDFDFTNGTTWDNNGSQDWHLQVYTTVVPVQVSPAPVASKAVTIYYNGTLAASATTMTLHWGYNNFTVPTDVIMTKQANGQWAATITLPVGSYMLNMAFKNNASIWDSNSSANYNYSVAQ